MSGTLFLIPNLLGVAKPEDVLPQRTIAVANRITHFVVETPKVVRAFIKSLNEARVIADLSIVPCEPYEYSIKQMLAWLAAGHDVGVISDAGCPGMADPGAVLVAAAHAKGFVVVPLVGPSSALLGLMASGFNGQAFTFHGYLPAKPPEREAALKQIERSIRSSGATHFFIETPYRNAPMLEAICTQVAGNISLCAAQNLASADERIMSKPIQNWSAADRASFGGKAPTLFLLGRTA